MNVTSLLNSSGAAAAAEQQKQKEMESDRQPTRNRTPWDAGGYSLPINTHAIAPTPLLQKTLHEEERLDDGQIPISPKHRFSDSRSSISSFASSLQSATHSRFSSMSTVNSAHPVSSTTMDNNISPKGRNAPLSLELTTIEPRSDHRPSNSLSPTGSLDALAFVAEHHPFSQQVQQISDEFVDSGAASDGGRRSSSVETAGRGRGRASSPSDAILIKRPGGGAVPPLRLNTEDLDLMRAGHQHPDVYFSTPFPENNQLSSTQMFQTQPFSAQSKSQHKRSASAPDFFQAQLHQQRPSAYRMMSDLRLESAQDNQHEHNMSRASSISHTSGMRLIGPQSDPTPPSSHHPDHPSPTATSLTLAAPDTPRSPRADAEGTQHELRCMFVVDCDTNSTLRKAISHIFGRNKMCTRLIPSRVWVHYCRKHYQRSRYRNPKEYAKLQCDLVQEQIRRIHDWSLKNSAAGQPGVVQDWGLAIRKREQKRLDDIQGASRKRRAATFENDDIDGEGEADDGPAVFTPPTAVPKWLLDQCGKGYSTIQILEIFNKLHAEVLQDLIPQFPDIEILPNITTDNQETPKSPKGYAKRTPSTSSSHRRSQSLGVSMSHTYVAADRRASQPTMWRSGEGYGSPQQKRRRVEDEGMERFSSFQRSRMGAAPRMQQMPYRQVIPNIEEYGAEESYTSYQQSSLPAPVPQRSNGQAMVAYLENNNDHMQGTARRPMHGRSQSDVSGFGGRMSYNQSPPSGYVMDPYQQQNRQFAPQAQAPTYGYGVPPQYREEQQYPSPQGPRPDMHMGNLTNPGFGHQRHQSTPMNQFQSPGNGYGNNYGRDPQSFQQQPQDNRQFARHGSMSSSMSNIRISEHPSAGNIFTERR